MLRSYAYKQFGSIEKRMKVGEYPTFQDFVKSINTFYASLIDSGPDLPKKELVYLDFLKKAIPQGAEVFLRGMQDSHNRQVAELDDRRVTLQTELQQLAKEMTLRQVASQ